MSDGSALTEATLAFFRDNGYCLVPGVVPAKACRAVRALFAEAQELAARGGGGNAWRNDATAWERLPGGTSARMVRKVPAPFDRSAEFRAIFGGDRILDLVEQIIGPEIYLHSSKLIYKPPGIGRRKPFHQDLAYWDDMTAPQVTLWCPIDPATAENGCLEIVPRSHHQGLIEHEDLDDWQIEESRFAPGVAQAVEMAPGDLLFLDVLTVHASRANRSKQGRLAAIVNYYSAPKAADQRSKYGSSQPLRGRRQRPLE